MIRVAAYIDGYNMYHAIKRFNEPHLKWVDLWELANVFVPPKSSILSAVYYYSAYADWLPGPMSRHKAYVSALQARGVSVTMSNFKIKDRRCPSCKHRYKGHEEKETDVQLALDLLQHAHEDRYDRALVISRDSDIVPAAKMTKSAFPKKELYVVAPPGAGHSNDMIKICDGKHKIQRKHLMRCLLPKSVPLNPHGIVVRPTEYDPPPILPPAANNLSIPAKPAKP